MSIINALGLILPCTTVVCYPTFDKGSYETALDGRLLQIILIQFAVSL